MILSVLRTQSMGWLGWWGVACTQFQHVCVCVCRGIPHRRMISDTSWVSFRSSLTLPAHW